MNTLKTKVVMVAVVLGMSLAASRSEAHEHDFRTGTFYGNWCGFSAKFEIHEKVGDSWDFKGKITILRTGQVDDVTIRQYENNRLRIIRHLSGAHAGTNQWVDTHPPESKVVNDKVIVNFPVRSAGGYGAKIEGFLRMPKK